MKKALIFILLFIGMFSLTSCSKNPFNPIPGTEIVHTDTLSYSYYNGKTTTELFEYTFSQEYYFFIGTLDKNYSFTTINNYLDISNEFITFLEYYDSDIVFDRYLNETYGDELRLSLGATNGDYNLTKISVDDDIYDVDAYISIENGLRIVFSYTEFYHNDELIIIPYFFAIQAYEIYEAYSKEYLAADNDYVLEKAILTKYITHIIPLPPKSGIELGDIEDENNFLTDLGHYMRIVQDETNSIPHFEEVCTELVTENCFEEEFSDLSGYIYEYSIAMIISFYEENYGGLYDGDNFIFFVDEESYEIVLIRGVLEIEYADKPNESIDIVTYEITKYNN